MCPDLGGDSSQNDNPEERIVVERDDAFNLIGSTVGLPIGWHGGQYRQQNPDVPHMPVLDIDHQCYLLPSETPGHFHLYIDVPMSWENYAKLIEVMGEVGILEPGYVNMSRARMATFVAPEPWKEAARERAARADAD
jgi:hypothetical protein